MPSEIFVKSVAFLILLSSLIFSRPEDHAGLLFQIRRKIPKAAIFHARCHAVLHAGRLEPLFCQMGTKNADFGRKWEVRKIHAAVRQLLLNLEHFYAAHSRLVFVFLGARQLAAVASGAVLIVNQQSVFNFFLVHAYSISIPVAL
jgi:hypothetical protein